MTDYPKDELATKDAQIKAMGEEIDRLQVALVQAAREIERLRGHVRELMEQRNALQDMAKAAVKFGDLGGGR